MGGEVGPPSLNDLRMDRASQWINRHYESQNVPPTHPEAVFVNHYRISRCDKAVVLDKLHDNYPGVPPLILMSVIDQRPPIIIVEFSISPIDTFYDLCKCHLERSLKLEGDSRLPHT